MIFCKTLHTYLHNGISWMSGSWEHSLEWAEIVNRIEDMFRGRLGKARGSKVLPVMEEQLLNGGHNGHKVLS